LKLPGTVVALGLVSLLTDTSSEAIFPLLPAFLTAFGASNTFIGLVEGAAELVANVLKYPTGLAADRRARLKPLVLAGYGISTAVRPLVAFALAPWHVLVIRLADRVGKGVRTSPRDALIAAVTDPSIRARAYGFHRAMDHAGAAWARSSGSASSGSWGRPTAGRRAAISCARSSCGLPCRAFSRSSRSPSSASRRARRQRPRPPGRSRFPQACGGRSCPSRSSPSRTPPTPSSS
jgi:MFS family permease